MRSVAASSPEGLSRRDFVSAAAALAVAAAFAPARVAAQEAEPFDRARVIERARALAAAEYVPPAAVPQSLLDLSFADHQRIRARPETWLFASQPNEFAVEPLHSGFIYREPVELYAVRDGRSVKIVFEQGDFDYADLPPPPPDAALEFAGFRGRTTLNAPDRLDPFVVFAGASYFQAIARGQTFGLSARGLAIGTGERNGEEFPSFRAFWLETPNEGRMVVHALLDSPSVAGAYRFTIRPGETTLIDVEATLFARAEITRLGLAPLTAMHLFGPNGARDDVRRAVHDSDGLAIWNGKDERIWRPLTNPRLLQVSMFADNGPRGFGLIQREKRFSEYEDIAAAYHRRPSLWVEPIGDWGLGSVVLVEIPSDREINDNVVAFWRPEAPLAAGGETTLTYRLTWGWDAPSPSGLMRVTRTLTGAGPLPGWRSFVVDYSDPGGQAAAAAAEFAAHARTSAGTIGNVVVAANPAINGLRVSFDLDPAGQESADLRVDLLRREAPAAEVWVYRWTS